MNNKTKNDIIDFCIALDNLTEQTSITCAPTSSSIVIKIIKYHLTLSNKIYHLTITTGNNWENQIKTFLEFVNDQDASYDTSRQSNKQFKSDS